VSSPETWKRDDAQSTIKPAPTLALEKTSSGYRVKWSTAPAYEIVFDGREHALPAANMFNAAKFRGVDARTIEQTPIKLRTGCIGRAPGITTRPT
jgi:hypothetical protein